MTLHSGQLCLDQLVVLLLLSALCWTNHATSTAWLKGVFFLSLLYLFNFYLLKIINPNTNISANS